MTTVAGGSSGSRSSIGTSTVWLVEDNELYRRTIRELLDAAEGISCPVAAESVERALAALATRADPDIVLMDIGLPGMDGIAGTRAFRSRCPAARVVILTVHDEDEKVFDAICAGASGYLLKPDDAEGLVAAVRAVRDGAAPINGFVAGKLMAMLARLAPPPKEYGLTAREREILGLLVEGTTMRRVAARLGLSYHTIDTHCRHIYEKLHVHTRASAVAKAVGERLA